MLSMSDERVGLCACLLVVFVIVFVVVVRVPCEPLFVERDDNLWAPDVGLSGRHQVGLVGIFPVKD